MPFDSVPVRIENSFIPVEGVGDATERRLWRAGVTEWNAFDPALVGPRTARRIESFIEVASDRLAAGDVAFFDDAFPAGERWRLFEDFRATTGYLDIETTGLSSSVHDVTVVSLHRADRTRTLVRGDDLARDTLRDALEGIDLLVTFNGARFDVPFLESAFDLAIDLPHLDLMYPCRRVGLTGGLKHIERRIGIARDGPDIGGRDAVRLWHAFRRGDDDALETLITYNRADTANLADLAEHVCSTLHDVVFEAALSTEQQRL